MHFNGIINQYQLSYMQHSSSTVSGGPEVLVHVLNIVVFVTFRKKITFGMSREL